MKGKTNGGLAPSVPREALLRIAAATRDTASIESAIKGWIVPLLVKEFLAEQTCRFVETKVKNSDSTTKAVGMEDVASRHIK